MASAAKDLVFEKYTASSSLENNTPEIRFFFIQSTLEQIKKAKKTGKSDKLLRMAFSNKTNYGQQRAGVQRY
ncbi:hypothetical protein AYI69_g8282 [Smittium culicis]|uniref:Uncharacterized protein n=1 Tax=Smittium culicis TaxID=133412 RepID=A0A1R1X3J1_9FUNG|nr:hypothetical protein AYI69_g10773 [Smittium culicis]OMJ15190.1 hypothetical protein AYI69_g8282 [Smittium culicis]